MFRRRGRARRLVHAGRSMEAFSSGGCRRARSCRSRRAAGSRRCGRRRRPRDDSLPSAFIAWKCRPSGNAAGSWPRSTPCMSVSITPGASATAFAFRAARAGSCGSALMQRVNMSSAALPVQYAAVPSIGRRREARRDVQHPALGIERRVGREKARREQHRGGDVDVDRRGERGRIERGDRPDRFGQRRVVDQRVERRVARQAGRDRGCERIGRADVGEVLQIPVEPRVVRARGCGERVVRAAGDADDAPLGRQQPLDQRGAEALRRAGDDDDLHADPRGARRARGLPGCG